MSIDFTPSTTSLMELENGKEVFMVNRKDENGLMFRKEIRTPALVSALVNMEALAFASKISSKGLSIEIGSLDLESLKKEGFKSVSEFVQSADFGVMLDSNTINRYRRIGKAFGLKESTEDGKTSYQWYGVDNDVTVTNLAAILSLIEFPEKFESATIDELHESIDVFISRYIDTDKLHLSAPLKTLRAEIKALSEVVMDTTATEVTEDATEATEDATEATEATEVTEATEESAIVHIDALRVAFKGNKKALDMLSKLADMLEK